MLMRGAEPFKVEQGGGGCCLLLHGWLTSPSDFGELPNALSASGWSVYAPLHPGHGTHPSQLEGVTADEILASARNGYEQLAKRYEKVVLVGFSMGGTIATILASERKPTQLVLVAPFFGARYRWYHVLPVRWWARILSPIVHYVRYSQNMVPVNRPGGASQVVGYRAFPTSAVHLLFDLRQRATEEAKLERLDMPVLLMYTPSDDLCSATDIEQVLGEMPASEKQVISYDRSNHHIFHDYDREDAIRQIISFIGDP